MRENTVRFAHVLCDFMSLYLFVLAFVMILNCQIQKHFSSLWQMKNDVRFEYVP